MEKTNTKAEDADGTPCVARLLAAEVAAKTVRGTAEEVSLLHSSPRFPAAIPDW